jgi:hypothetical protein
MYKTAIALLCMVGVREKRLNRMSNVQVPNAGLLARYT